MRVVIESDVDRIELADSIPVRPPIMWLAYQGLEGWYETPGLKGEFPDNPVGDGSLLPLELRQQERTLTIRGFAGPNSSLETGSLIDRLNDLICRPLKVTVFDQQSDRWVHGVIHDGNGMTIYPEGTDLGFSLTLTCTDPLKYGHSSDYPVVNGRARVENTGRVPVFPKVTVSNRIGLTFVNVSDMEGHRVNWVADGTVNNVELDFRRLTPLYGTVTTADLFKVPPGMGTVYVTTDASALATVSVVPAWR